VEITVRYIKGENAMTLKNREDAMWAYQAFIKEYS
jgi:hypothetical protein